MGIDTQLKDSCRSYLLGMEERGLDLAQTWLISSVLESVVRVKDCGNRSAPFSMRSDSFPSINS